MGRQAALIALVLAGCASAPFGELLVVVDSDVAVPGLVSRLRLDLYDSGGAWYESREIGAGDPTAWPLSFGLYTDDPAGKAARVRLRAFPEGAVRDYRGEQPPGPPPFVQPMVAEDVATLCAAPPTLPPFTELVQRRGGALVTQHVSQADCVYPSAAGAVAARVDIAVSDTYRFEIVRATPDGSRGIIGGDTILSLRRDCADAATQLACSDDIDPNGEDLLSRLELPLDPGTYFLVTGGKPEASPADLTLRWAPASRWSEQPPSAPPMVDPALPRLVVDGVDATPSSEPQPALAIDRLLDVSIAYGEQRRVGVTLAGECLGTAADLAGGTSCIDHAGERAAFDASLLGDGGGGTVVGTWPALAAQPCAVMPRDGDPELLDGQVCVPGGTFTLGTDEVGGVGVLDPSPRQVAVVAPFLLDRNEVTVARYRKALRDGFVPPSTEDFDQIVNDGPLARDDPRRGCTFSGDADGPAAGVDRERYPLDCISWRNARGLCQFLGGDLPTHVEWEYAASAAGSDAKRRYPWGDDAPDCARAVYGRAGGGCLADEPGPVAVDATPWADGDRTPLGLVGMAGNVGEWALDAFRPYRDACWWQRPLRDVGCSEDQPPERSIRGASWLDVAQALPSALILGQAPEFPDASTGVRCAYRGAP